MSIGNQIISTRYKDPVDAKVWNKRTKDIIPTGIYRGLEPQFVIGQTTLTLTTGVVESKTKDLVDDFYMQNRVEFRDNVILDTDIIYQALGSLTFYIVVEYLYEQSEIVFSEIKGIIIPDNNLHIKICFVTVNTSGQIQSVDISPTSRDFIGKLMGMGIYDRNEDGIVDNADKVDGKHAVSGQDIKDALIIPNTVPDHLVTICNDLKYPDQILPPDSAVHIFNDPVFVVSIGSGNGNINFSSFVDSEASAVILRLELMTSGFDGSSLYLYTGKTNPPQNDQKLTAYLSSYEILPGEFYFTNWFYQTINPILWLSPAKRIFYKMNGEDSMSVSVYIIGEMF